MSNWEAMVERTTILRADIGSHGFGLNTDGSDYDHKGVCIEDYSSYVRLEGKFEQFNRKFPVTDTFPGMDLEIFSLEKFIRLALNGNPTVLSLLFAAPVAIDERGKALQAMAPRIVSQRAGKAFLGYMESQRQKLKGEIGQKRVTRTDLIEKHGFDTKFAMHLLRLGMQGIEIMETGRLTMPFVGTNRDFLRSVREGKVSLDNVLQKAGDLERSLRDLLGHSPLPDLPDYEFVDTWMRSMYWHTWTGRDKQEFLLRRTELWDEAPVVH